MSVSLLNPTNKPNVQVITSMQLRRQSGKVLNRLEYRGESFIISRDGKPVALLTPLPTTEDKSQGARNKFMQMTSEIQDKFADVSTEETQKLIEDAIAWARQST